ncbi:FAD-binding domain-containing protein [Imleria badia]|nr:FAD-binding domain-containing protein [Imleria badia]
MGAELCCTILTVERTRRANPAFSFLFASGMLRATILPFIAMATLGSAIRRVLAVGDTNGTSTSNWGETCQKIATSISAASDVYYFLSEEYQEDISHWALSSTQVAACSFEPGTPEDVGIALKILGQTKTPFAVKGGGHTGNPGFSSTPGVQIAMSRFSDVDYNSEAQTATFGSGLIWDDVYAKLEPYGVNVAGGRISGVGVAGFTLGGGYTWFTNQYGLTIDTVQAFELVMPNGTAINVTDTSSPDLFFALKGGQNNFGIVTRFTLKTFPQSQVWGGVTIFPTTFITQYVLGEITQATANFVANNKDPKAAIITSYNYLLGLPVPTVILFYDAPTPPPGIFDEFLNIFPSLDGIATRNFTAFVKSVPNVVPVRIIPNSISVTNYTHTFLQSVADEASYWATNLVLESDFFINYDAQPFLPTLLTHNTSPSAYPPDRTRGLSPLEISFSWVSPLGDQVVYDAIRTTAQRLQAKAIAEGLSDADTVVYPNFAIYDTPLDKLYGANVPRLQAIKKAVDPNNVMGLAGGFKL